jgi:hypothetical protein
MCEATEYEVADEFMYAANCHCTRCRAATGSAFKPFAGIAGDKVRLTKGADTVSVFGSKGNGDFRCGACGSFLFSRLKDGRVHVGMGSLVDTPTIRVSEHIFVANKAPWFTITDDLPQYAGHVSDGPPINR